MAKQPTELSDVRKLFGNEDVDADKRKVIIAGNRKIITISSHMEELPIRIQTRRNM